MAQRISRAKQRVKASGVPFRMPAREEWTPRLRSVLHVLYLVFSEGYTTSSGPRLHRTDLSNEAIRLTREVHRLLPDDGEVAGLLAVSRRTLWRMVARGEVPEPIRYNRKLVRWKSSDIARYLDTLS